MRTNWSIDVAYNSDLSQAISTIQAVLEADTRILSEPQPQVFVAGFSDLALAVNSCGGQKCGFLTAEGLRLALKNRFEVEGIEIPSRSVWYSCAQSGDKQQARYRT